MKFPEKTISVPVNGSSVNIDVSDMVEIIDTPVFQKLGEIQQLSNVDTKFHSAVFTRKEHIIGSLYYARKVSIISCIGMVSLLWL